jgi:thioredoxin 1
MNYTPSTQVIEEIKSPNRTLVVFSANWCGPCKAMNPMLEKAIEEGHRIFKINVDEDADFSSEHGIKAIPASFLYEEGNQLKRQPGKFDSYADLVKFITTPY